MLKIRKELLLKKTKTKVKSTKEVLHQEGN